MAVAFYMVYGVLMLTCDKLRWAYDKLWFERMSVEEPAR